MPPHDAANRSKKASTMGGKKKCTYKKNNNDHHDYSKSRHTHNVAPLRKSGKTVLFHAPDQQHPLLTSPHDEDVTLIGYTSQPSKQKHVSRPDTTPASLGTFDTSALVRLHKDDAELSFWHRAAHRRHLYTALLSCDVDLTCVDIGSSLSCSSDNNNSHPRKYTAINNDATAATGDGEMMSVDMHNTLTAFSALSEDRLGTALQSLLDLSVLLHLYPRHAEQAMIDNCKACHDARHHRVNISDTTTASSATTTITTMPTTLTDNSRHNTSEAIREEGDGVDLRSAGGGLPQQKVPSKSQHDDFALESIAPDVPEPRRCGAVRRNEGQTYCCWVRCEHYAAAVALAELSEAAVPPRSPSLLHLGTLHRKTDTHSRTNRNRMSSNKGLPANGERHDDHEDKEDGNDVLPLRTVPTSTRCVKDNKGVTLVPSPVLYSAVCTRIASVRRLWQLRFTYRALMPAIRACRSGQALSYLLFAHSPAAMTRMSHHQSMNTHNTNSNIDSACNVANRSPSKSAEFHSTTSSTFILLPYFVTSQSGQPGPSYVPPSLQSIRWDGAITADADDDALQAMYADGFVPLHPPHAQHRYESEVLSALVRTANAECEVDREVWGVCGNGSEHLCVTDLHVVSGTYTVQHAVRQRVMARLLEQTELYGLPPFLRSIRRLAQSAAVRRSHMATSPDVWGDFLQDYMPGILGDETRAWQNKTTQMSSNSGNKKSNNTNTNSETIGPSTQYPYIFFLSPTTLDPRSFVVPDATQGQVVQEEIINLIMSQCCFGMLVGAADQIVFLAKAVNEFIGARRLRRGEGHYVKKEEQREETVNHHGDNEIPNTAAVAASSHTALRDPLAPYVRKALQLAQKPLSVMGDDLPKGDINNNSSSGSRCDYRQDQMSCSHRQTSYHTTTSSDSGLTANRLSVTWLCNNRWSSTTTYYGLVFCAVVENELEAVEEGETAGCPVDVEMTASSLNKLRPLREVTYYVCGVVELRRQS